MFGKWSVIASGFVIAASAVPTQANAWAAEGVKLLVLHDRSGGATQIGTVTFEPRGERTAFKVRVDPEKTKVFFLSMHDFRCLEGPEVTCYIPYPYENVGTIMPGNLAWLEHALLFLTKSPREFGAKFENGVYFALTLTDHGFVGKPQAIDLNVIASEPADPAVPPYSEVERRDDPSNQRWISSLTIEDGPQAAP